jgi:hypothetical protein
MAIFTVTSNAVENVDIFYSSSFKSGMALMRDDNGRAVPADGSLLLYKTTEQKVGKFLGFATSDYSSSSNTIIFPDVIGSSYIDNSYNYVRTENNEVVISKRALVDNQNEAINMPYNPSENLTNSRRGMAVYNQPNNIFITDQFSRVLHGDFGVDSTQIIDFNSGDLLTFGSGINAGKLVKLNVNSIGPDVLVIGIVEKFIPSTNLLHFRQAPYLVTFQSNNLQFAIDAANPYSYTSGNTVYDLSKNGNNGTLFNGVTYSTFGGGSFYFDGTNDYIKVLDSPSLNPGERSFTTMTWVKIDGFPNDNLGGNIILNKENIYETGYYSISFDYAYLPVWAWRGIGAMDSSAWKLITVTYDKANQKAYVNNTLTSTIATTGDMGSNTEDLGIGARSVKTGPNSYAKMYLSEMRIYFTALSTEQIQAYYNATKGRYGL